MKAAILLFLFFSGTTLIAQKNRIEQSSIDVLNYDIKLQFDWKKKCAIGEVKISCVFTSSAKKIELDANQLLIKTVFSENKQAFRFETNTANNKLLISLPKKYRKGEEIKLIICYQTQYQNQSDPNAIGGSFGKGIRFFEPTEASPTKRKQLWSHSGLMNTAYWLPCKNFLSDLATTDITATVENNLTFIATGNLVEETANSDGTHLFHYKTTHPHPVYLNAFVVGEYTDLKQEVNGTTLHTFCYPEEVEAAKATTVQLKDMFSFLEQKTGFSYPFESYSQVMVQDFPFPGLYGQNGLSIVSDNMIDDYGTHKDFLYLWDGVEFNALASQWFGNVLIPEKTEDMWLALGFAQYFEGLYSVHENGLEEYLLWINPWENGSVFGDWYNGNQHAVVPKAIEAVEQFASDSYSKYKAALVLRMLENEIGAEQFMKVIQMFIKENAFKPVSTRDFQRTVQSFTSKDYAWFFNQWFYTSGHPIFELSHKYMEEKHELQLSIKQVQDSIVPHFQGRMEVEIDDSIYRIELKAISENTFSIPISKVPQVVNLDPENHWLKEVIEEKNMDEWLTQFRSAKHILSRNTAMIQLASIAKQESTTEVEKKEIVEAFHTVISSNNYWRLRLNAITQLRSFQVLPYDETTKELLLLVAKSEQSWLKAAAINSLGMTKDSSYADLYISCFSDTSDRVRNAAAIALGKSGSKNAFDELLKLKEKPSWKSQSLMHCLAGMAQLKDERVEAIAISALTDLNSPRWFLGNSWDYPFVAVQTLAAIGKVDKAIELLLERFDRVIKTDNSDDIFHLVNLIVTLGNERGMIIFEQLKAKYKTDENAMNAIQVFEDQLKHVDVK